MSFTDAVPEGRHALRFEFEPTGPPDFAVGKGSPDRFELYVDGTLVGAVEVPHTTPMIYELEGLSCGYDALAQVLPDVYESPHDPLGDDRRQRRAHRGRRAALTRLMAQQ